MRQLTCSVLTAAALAALPFLTACRPAEQSAPSAEDTLAQREEELRQREAEVAQREAEVAEREEYAAEPEAAPLDRIPLAEPPLPAPQVVRPAAPRPAPRPAPEPVPQPAPAPEPEPAPAVVWEPEPKAIVLTVLVPAGTTFEVEFLDGLSTDTSQVGQTFQTRAVNDVMVGSGVAVPAGSTITGRVTDVRNGRRIGGRSMLALAFDELRLPDGETFPLQASFAAEGKSERGRDAATIGGATAGGAILGHAVKDSDKGTLIGAILGAAIGSGIAASTAGQPVELPAGTVVALTLDQQLSVRRTLVE